MQIPHVALLTASVEGLVHQHGSLSKRTEWKQAFQSVGPMYSFIEMVLAESVRSTILANKGVSLFSEGQNIWIIIQYSTDKFKAN